MNENSEMVLRTEDGVIVRVDAQALITLFQEHLCKGKLTLIAVEDREDNN